MIKEKIVYQIKHSRILKFLYVFLGSTFFRILGIFVKTDENLVLFVSNIGKGYSGSPREIYKYIRAREEYKKYHCIWAFNEPEKYTHIGVKTVKFDSWKYFIISLRAKYWVTDVNIERSLRYKKSKTYYLNTWHGVALKKIGNDDLNSGTYNYSKLNYLCVSSEYDKKVFKSALKAPDSSFLECGMPRNDVLFKATEEDRKNIRNKLKIPKDKKILLYAPTWRDSNNRGLSYDLKIKADFRKWEKYLSQDYVLLFRAHDRTTKLMDIKFNEFIRNFSDYDDLNELLIVTDILITDYSSIVFDYSILKRPFICFGYDYDEYYRTRGVYFDPEKIYPSGVLRSEDEVIDKLLHYDFSCDMKAIEKFNNKFMEYSRGNATSICVKALFGMY